MTNNIANEIQDIAKSITQNANDQLQDLQSQYWKASDNLREAKLHLGLSKFKQLKSFHN